LFPGNIIASNISISNQLTRLLGDLGLPIDQRGRIGQEGGPELYRFRAIHLVKPRFGQEVVELSRGGQTLPGVAIGEAEIDALIERYVRTLLDRQGEEGLYAGSFDPTSSQFLPEIASLSDTAIANIALARAAELSTLAPGLREEAREAAQRGVRAMMLIRAEIKPRQYRLGSTAACVLALLETPGVGAYQNELLRLGQDMLSMRNNEHHLFRTSFEEGTSAATVPQQAMAAAAMTRLFEMNRNPAVRVATTATLNALWAQLDNHREVARAMPWLAYAELRMAELGELNPRIENLREALDQTLAKQVGRDGEDAPADTIGGLERGMDLYGGPTWETSEILMGLSMVLGSGQLVDEADTLRWLSQCGLAARFVKQLTMRPHDCYYTRIPDFAVGAVRASLHNNRQTLEATASALMAMVELRGAINKLTAAGVGELKQ
jgi:hypothetical protein